MYEDESTTGNYDTQQHNNKSVHESVNKANM